MKRLMIAILGFGLVGITHAATDPRVDEICAGVVKPDCIALLTKQIYESDPAMATDDLKHPELKKARMDNIKYQCENISKNAMYCADIISEQLDGAYMLGEENAHLYKRQKIAEREAFINSEPMLTLCNMAPDAPRCEKLRGYIMEEYNAGIGLDKQ